MNLREHPNLRNEVIPSRSLVRFRLNRGDGSGTGKYPRWTTTHIINGHITGKWTTLMFEKGRETLEVFNNTNGEKSKEGTETHKKRGRTIVSGSRFLSFLGRRVKTVR